MKKLIFVLFGFVLSVISAFSQQLSVSLTYTENTVCDGVGCNYDGPSILINEIMLTPNPFDGSVYGITPSHNPSVDCRGEWIELYNPDNCKPVDISCYFLGNAAYESSTLYPAGFILPEGTIVPPLGFVIVRGINAPAVPSELLVQNGGNTVEIIVNDLSRICLSGGYRLWFPNAGGWFAFYDKFGVPQDAISWNNNNASTFNACNPGVVNGCNYTGQLASYNSIPADRKNYISPVAPQSNKTFRRIPDGGAWGYNSPATPTYGTCNAECAPEPIITCNGTATVNITGGTPPYTIVWDDGQIQTTSTAYGLCEGQYCVTVTDSENEIATGCIYLYNNEIDVSASTTTPSVCAGEALDLHATYSGGTSPYSVAWSGPAGYSNTGSDPQILNSQLSQSGTYQLTVIDYNGCSATSQADIVVNPLPVPVASNNGPVCSGADLELFTQNFNSYSWSGPGGFTSILQNPVVSDIQTYQSGLYSVVVSNQYNCSATGQTLVELLPSPELTVSGTNIYCEGETIQLNSNPAGLSDYQWTGAGDFTAYTQNISRPNATPAMSGTYTVSANSGEGCPASGSYNITVYPMVNAEISEIPDMCINDPVYTLNAVSSGGTWSGPGVSANVFNPEEAGAGNHTISYSVSNVACSDSDTETVTVFNSIQILNFTDELCNDTYTEYTVSFDVVDDLDDLTGFLADFGDGFQFYSGTFTHNFTSQTSYSITVTDPEQQCSEYVFNGFRDCGCVTWAGTMTSLQIVKLCYGECSDNVNHNGNQVLDADDTFGFILHTGEFPLNIIAYSSTPEFCFHLISGLNFGQIYYISAVAGNEITPGIPDINDPCFSVSQGTPVVWYQNPVAYINTDDFSVCGLEACFDAPEPMPGMEGSWSSSSVYFPINGTNNYSEEICVLVTQYGNHEFVRCIANGNCMAFDTITVTFVAIPNANAGEDFTVCGYAADLTAIPSSSGSTGQWTGTGNFSSVSSPATTVNISPPPGTYSFSWEETVGECSDVDQVLVTFIPNPNPVIFPLHDTVCGTTYNLSVGNVQGSGIWSAYSNGELLAVAPFYVSGITSPVTTVIIPNYQGYFQEIEFVWTETMQVYGTECSAEAHQYVVFAREPIASVGAVNEAERCGTCMELAADTTGSGWADGSWIPMNVSGSWTSGNQHNPVSTFCINEVGNFGDDASVRVPFLWVMNNHGCTSIDTMFVTFYQRPVANAGLDNAVCGNIYGLGAVYSLAECSEYVPSGIWSVYDKPDPLASADISPLNSDTTTVSVSHYGIWDFVFRENNAFYNGCYDTDTVRIEFIEVPVISAGPDKDVCGFCTEMEGIDGGHNGLWVPNGATYDDYYDPLTNACVNISGPKLFIWLESNHSNITTLSCSSKDTVIITFWAKPTPTILTDSADNFTCGLRFDHLRAELSGTGITGYWYCINSSAQYGNVYSNSTWVQVPEYGYHDFYWIEETGPELSPGFCIDTAGPLTINFIEIPHANAGNDTLFCGYCGSLNAIPSVGTGVWSTPSVGNITFENQNDPNTLVCSDVLNTGNATNPHFIFRWTEDNSNGCTDKDSILVIFAREPSSGITIIPPKCFGEPATIAAVEDSLYQYNWDFQGGIVDSTSPANLAGGIYEQFVYWTDGDTTHEVDLTARNYWGCESPVNVDTVHEPPIPLFDVTLVSDTCSLGKGGIIFGATSENSFFWINPEVGPAPGPVTEVYNLPAGTYDIRASYLTPNITHYSYYINTFGTANCVDTVQYDIETIGMIEAGISISADVILEDLVAPNANVIFLNTSDYDNVSKRCEWHFDDGTIVKNCDELVEHVYTEAGCYEPFLIVMNRDLPECRDTAYLDACVKVDNASKLEIPNVFSPNGDGINDFFQVKARTLRTFSGIIVNRWGRTVYEWTNWEDYEAGWDGKLDGGTEASPGVYFYIIKAEGMDEALYDEQGAFHLMRE